MRIVIAAGIYPPDIGGPATYAEAVSHFCVAQGHTVQVVTFANEERRSVEPGITVEAISRKRSKLLAYIRYALVLFRAARRADRVYAQGPVAGGLHAYLIQLMTGKPYLVKVTGDYAWEQGVGRYGLSISVDDFQRRAGAVPFPVRVLRIVQTRVVRGAMSVIVPSEYLGKMVQGWGVRPDKVRVIYNAVAGARRTLTPEAARERLGITGHCAISIGRFVPWKGFYTLIEEWVRIRASVSDAKLYIIGAGPERARLEQVIGERGLSSAVFIVGKQTAEELSVWYQAADCFVLNSGYEGLSHTILEAMSHRTPCIVSDSGGNPELIKHEVSGLVFGYDQRDAIVRSLIQAFTDPSAMQNYAQQAYAWVQGHGHTDMLQATLAALEHSSDTSR